jgi:hypothetical protein
MNPAIGQTSSAPNGWLLINPSVARSPSRCETSSGPESPTPPFHPYLSAPRKPSVSGGLHRGTDPTKREEVHLVRIHIWIRRREPLVGHASVDGRKPVPFEGWLDLLQRLSDLVWSSPAEEPGAEGDVAQCDEGGRGAT